MAERLTFRLPDELGHALRTAAVRTRCKMSEIVRLALRDYLGPSGVKPVRPADQVRHLLGSLQSGSPDLGPRGRDDVLESIRRGG